MKKTKKTILAFILFNTLLFNSNIKAEPPKEFTEAFQELDNIYPTMLDLKIERLNISMQNPLGLMNYLDNFYNLDNSYYSENSFFSGSSSSSCDFFDKINYAEFSKNTSKNKIIITIHLNNSWYKNMIYYDEDQNKTYLSRNDFIKIILDAFIQIIKKDIHELFSSHDAVVLFMVSKENCTEELILKYDNDIPYYQDGFFEDL